MWVVKLDGKILKAAEVIGEDPSGFKAYEAASEWAEVNAPEAAFTWKHWRGDASDPAGEIKK